MGAQNSATILIGLDDQRMVRRLTVRWPSGTVTRAEDLPAGTLVTMRERADAAGVDKTFRTEPYERSPGARTAARFG